VPLEESLEDLKGMDILMVSCLCGVGRILLLPGELLLGVQMN
jgi:hypothetical protein